MRAAHTQTYTSAHTGMSYKIFNGEAKMILNFFCNNVRVFDLTSSLEVTIR